MVGIQHLSVDGVNLDFDLDVEEDIRLHLWETTISEDSLMMMASLLYQMIENHPITFFNKKIQNPRDFAATLYFSNFKTLQLNYLANVFQKSVLLLYDISTNGYYCKPQNIAFSFKSDSTNNSIIAMFELCSGNVHIGAVVV